MLIDFVISIDKSPKHLNRCFMLKIIVIFKNSSIFYHSYYNTYAYIYVYRTNVMNKSIFVFIILLDYHLY
jgi:ADP-heptose:LPS heptosyltransferase